MYCQNKSDKNLSYYSLKIFHICIWGIKKWLSETLWGEKLCKAVQNQSKLPPQVWNKTLVK